MATVAREAIPLHERTLADMERVLGPDHPETLTSCSNLATAYQAVGRVAEAIPLAGPLTEAIPLLEPTQDNGQALDRTTQLNNQPPSRGEKRGGLRSLFRRRRSS